MSFVRTPIGLIMHADNHRALVAQAKLSGLRGALTMLEPAEPISNLDGLFTTEIAAAQAAMDAKERAVDERGCGGESSGDVVGLAGFTPKEPA